MTFFWKQYFICCQEQWSLRLGVCVVGDECARHEQWNSPHVVSAGVCEVGNGGPDLF